MSAQLHDYYVAFRREEDITESASGWRRTGRAVITPDFNIVRFIEGTLMLWLNRAKGELAIKFFEQKNEDEPPAYVTIEPLTLWLDKELWDLANAGDPHARHVLAHEVGHVTLHGNYEKAAFSTDPKLRLKSFVNERSAEWQAETFASYFLLPTDIVAAFQCPRELAAACSVPLEMAERRFAQVREATLRKSHSSDYCPTCGNMGCTERH